jgi:hypothetical protein
LSGTQFSTLKSAGINDPEEPEKYNNIEVKYGGIFTAATQHLTPAVVKYNNTSSTPGQNMINKINEERHFNYYILFLVLT